MTLAVNSFKTVDRVANSVSNLDHSSTFVIPSRKLHFRTATFTGSASRRRGLKKYIFIKFIHLDYPSIPISNPLSFIPLNAQRISQLQVLTHSCHHIDMLDLKGTQMSFIRGFASSQHAYYMLLIQIDL